MSFKRGDLVVLNPEADNPPFLRTYRNIVFRIIRCERGSLYGKEKIPYPSEYVTVESVTGPKFRLEDYFSWRFIKTEEEKFDPNEVL